MNVHVSFYSYFKDLAGTARLTEIVPDGCNIGDLYQRLVARFPRLAGTQKSTLIAVGVDYQDRDHVLKEGDEVSLFPPVQGG
jgi:molybdopterin converting factor small subunit